MLIKPVMMLFFSLFFFIGLIFAFPNSLYFTFVLLLVSISSMYYMVSSFYLFTLTMILITIVYVGAIIILIGYICAICPNLNLLTSFRMYPFLLIGLFYSYFISSNVVSPSAPVNRYLEYLYTSDGVFLFVVIVVILFVTLLMVTCQYLVPRGPFRSSL